MLEVFLWVFSNNVEFKYPEGLFLLSVLFGNVLIHAIRHNLPDFFQNYVICNIRV